MCEITYGRRLILFWGVGSGVTRTFFLYTVTVYFDILFREVKKKEAHSNQSLIIFAFQNVKPFLKQCSVLSEK